MAKVKKTDSKVKSSSKKEKTTKSAAKTAKVEKKVKTAKSDTKVKSGKKSAKPEKESKKSKKSKLPVISDKLNATQLVSTIAERADTDNKTVKAVLEATQNVVIESLRKGGSGVVKVLGWNFKSTFKPASKGGEKRANPFKKGEFIITKPKPATMKLKALPLKLIKDSVAI